MESLYRILKTNIPEPGPETDPQPSLITDPQPDVVASPQPGAAAGYAAGLFLLPGATGTGKSHGVCQYIARHAGEWKQAGLKIYFTTRMLKNIPDNHSSSNKINQDEEDLDFFSTTTLRRAYEAAGRKKDYEKEVLVLRGMHTHLTESWEKLSPEIDSGVAAIAEDAKEPELVPIYEQYKREVEFFIKYGKDDKNDEAASFYAAQRRFLAALHRILEQTVPEKENRTREEIIKEREQLLFKKNSPWAWIPELWPDHRVSRSTVILLSLRKFSLPLISVLERNGPVKDSLSEGSLVFIDEFDDAKTAFLDFVIEESLQHKVDLMELARTVGASILQNTFIPPFLLTHASGNKEKTEQWIKEKNEQFDKLRKQYSDIAARYHLAANPKLRHTGQSQSVFLCRSWQPFIWSGKGTEKVINYSPEDQLNWIEDAKTKQQSEDQKVDEQKDDVENARGEPSLQKFVQDLLWFINHFLQLCNDIVLNKKYYLAHVRQKAGENNLINWSLEDYISSVVRHFVPENATIGEYLQYQLASLQYAAPHWKIHPGWFDGDSFYTNGFTEFFLEDSPRNEARTAINMISLSATPELWLSNLARRAFVVGLSATAYVDQPLTNFDLGYLRRTLGAQFKTISESDMRLLQNLYDSATKGYDNITFLPEKPALEYYEETTQEQTIERWARWLHRDKNMAVSVRNEIGLASDKINKNDIPFVIRRYDMVFQAMTYFARTASNRIMYCVNPNLFGEDRFYSSKPLEIFKDGLPAASSTYSPQGSGGWNLICMDSKNYELLQKEIKEGLAKGERYFVVTSFPTIGRGVNLQYRLDPEQPAAPALAPDIVAVHEHPRNDETEVDADGICIAKPTNIVVSNAGAFWSEKNTFQRLVQLHYLAAAGYITHQKLKEYIIRTVSGVPFSLEDSSAKDAINLAVASTVLQTLGRITRTGKRMRQVHILCDPEIPGLLAQTYLPQEVIKTKEYLHMCDHKENTDRSYDKEARFIEAETLSLQGIIKNLIANFDKEQNRKDWQNLRRYLLAHPTFNHMNEAEFKRCYCEIPGGKNRYYFETNGDFASCRVAFEQSPGTTWAEVSEESSGLPRLMNIAGVQDFLTNKGYATSWAPGAVFMNPVAFTNIYRGALGEAAAEFFFSKIFGIRLQEVEAEHFESFDFKFINAQNQVWYVDAKFWKIGPQLPDEEEQQRIAEKLHRCGGTRAIVINFYPAETEPERCLLPSLPELVIIPAAFVGDKPWQAAVDAIKGVL
ncbi:MAG: ATP-binding protein [Treponema sp.]|nr:ATP-binding protein [Treponema sp.]